MEATAENRATLKLYLGEPTTGGRFTDDQLDSLIEAADTLAQAAGEGWRLKENLLLDEYKYASINTGAETFAWQSLDQARAFCRERADYYFSKAGIESSTLILIEPEGYVEEG